MGKRKKMPEEIVEIQPKEEISDSIDKLNNTNWVFQELLEYGRQMAYPKVFEKSIPDPKRKLNDWGFPE